MKASIADYAVLGDGHTCALVHRQGSIDWLCWPRFDSPACLAALLGTDEHGRWELGPVSAEATSTRAYRPDTMVLETDYVTSAGRVMVVDFMPYHDGVSAVVRLVIGLAGAVSMRHDLALRFDYGRVMPWVERHDDGFSATVGSDQVTLCSPVAVTADPHGSHADFVVAQGDRVAFVLSHRESTTGGPPFAMDVERLLAETEQHGRAWIGRFDKVTDWPGAVRRSLLTLNALIDRKTGALVAAPTTSLPEIQGGSANWDYRFCWLRDASFTVSALLNAGLHEDAVAWRDWLLRAVGAEPAKLRIAYRVDGRADLHEHAIDWLPGYDAGCVVRVGNAASKQYQLDVFGEVLDALNLLSKAGIPASPHAEQVAAELVRHLERVWDSPGQDVWESRGDPKHYVYSKVMAWVGLDCYLNRAHSPAVDADTRRRLTELRSTIHAEICAKGYDQNRGTFVVHYGSDALDASLLLLPLVRFLPADDPRIERTVDAIERELMCDGLVMRQPTPPRRAEGRRVPRLHLLVRRLSIDAGARGRGARRVRTRPFRRQRRRVAVRGIRHAGALPDR